MSNDGNVPEWMIDDVKRHFDFLFERGYQIASTKEVYAARGVYEILLKHSDIYVRIDSEMTIMSLSFGSPSKGFTQIHDLLSFVTDGKENHTPEGLKKDAKVLEKYIDAFEACYGVDFSKNEEGLAAIKQEKMKQAQAAVLTSPRSVTSSPMDSIRLGFRLMIFVIYYFIFSLILPAYGINLGNLISIVISLGLGALTIFLISRRNK